MTQRGRRNEYKTSANTSQSAPAATQVYSTNRDYESKAADGNGSGLLAQMGAVASIVLATAHQGLMQTFDEILPRPSMALPLIDRSKKSQCFHYQPKKIIYINKMTTAVRTTVSSLSSISTPSQLDTTISRTSISSSSSSPTTTATTTTTKRAHRCQPSGLAKVLFTFTLVAGLSLIGGGQCAPINSIEITSQVKAPLEQLQQQANVDRENFSNQPETMVLIELASNQIQPLSSDQHEERQREQISEDDTILLVRTDTPNSRVEDSHTSSSAIRRLMKRSGISDQRLAEIQMIRALKKQLEKASKLAASNLNSAGQEFNSS